MTDRDTQGLADVIDYAVQQEKTEKIETADEDAGVMQRFVSGVNCTPATARNEMIAVKKRFGKEGGVVAYHVERVENGTVYTVEGNSGDAECYTYLTLLQGLTALRGER